MIGDRRNASRFVDRDEIFGLREDCDRGRRSSRKGWGDLDDVAFAYRLIGEGDSLSPYEDASLDDGARVYASVRQHVSDPATAARGHHVPLEGLHAMASLAHALDDSAVAVDTQPVPCANGARGSCHVRDARHAELACHDGRMRKRPPELGDHSGGHQE